jgi:hypothetical protein
MISQRIVDLDTGKILNQSMFDDIKFLESFLVETIDNKVIKDSLDNIKASIFKNGGARRAANEIIIQAIKGKKDS